MLPVNFPEIKLDRVTYVQRATTVPPVATNPSCVRLVPMPTRLDWRLAYSVLKDITAQKVRNVWVDQLDGGKGKEGGGGGVGIGFKFQGDILSTLEKAKNSCWYFA